MFSFLSHAIKYVKSSLTLILVFLSLIDINPIKHHALNERMQMSEGEMNYWLRIIPSATFADTIYALLTHVHVKSYELIIIAIAPSYISAMHKFLLL